MLYTRYVYYFEVAGLILLVAMIGAIVLTLSHKPGVRRQSIAAQVARTPATGVEIGQGAVGRRDHPRRRPGLSGERAHDHRHRALSDGRGAACSRSACFGIFLNRKNVIIILMSIELMLLAVNINFVAFSYYLGDLVGQVFALFNLTVAAAEAAIGLAIVVVYFRNRGSIAVEDINMMKG